MKKKSLIITTIFLIMAIFLAIIEKENSSKTDAQNPYTAENIQVFSSQNSKNIEEMRAIWIPFMSLDMKDTDCTESSFKNKFDSLVSTALAHKFNTLIVHVRPFCDALYPSQYFSWSHLLTNEQGKNPGFDPLKYMIKATHNAGLAFHAWINPLRIQVNDKPNFLCNTNVCYSLKKNNPEDIILETENGKYLNPAYTEVRKLIINGVKEIIENYDVDGVQFDDYFYPENSLDVDKISYENYCNLPENTQPLSFENWRFANINSLISGTYSAIKDINPNILFGISPAGNLANNYKIGADVETWCNTTGYIDYICPQIYFSLEHPILPSKTAAEQWKELIKCDKIKLYFGLAGYKAGSKTADYGTWENSNDILKTQVEQFRELGCDGFMLFSIESLKNDEATEEIKNLTSIFS